jgi:hypothetical protein
MCSWLEPELENEADSRAAGRFPYPGFSDRLIALVPLAASVADVSTFSFVSNFLKTGEIQPQASWMGEAETNGDVKMVRCEYWMISLSR